MFVVLPILSSNSYFPLCLSIHSKIGKLALYFTRLFFLFQVKVNKLTQTFWTLEFLYMSVMFISSPGMDQGAVGRGLRACVLNAYNALLQPRASHITIQKKINLDMPSTNILSCYQLALMLSFSCFGSSQLTTMWRLWGSKQQLLIETILGY